MDTSKQSIYIIGAGISGLVAAHVLESHGYKPVVLEATDRVGGRVKTDIVDGYNLDRGFQVLLTAYPAAQKYLDFDRLKLRKLVPGAAIFMAGKKKIIGDPLRDISLTFPTLFSGIGNVGDKLKIVKLQSYLKKKTLTDIFSDKEIRTSEYLESYGFSHEMIHLFFKPFFSGIFLEPALDTSSRMFEYVFKMFGEGYAALPELGMEAIPKQLSANLKKTIFKFNCPVASVKDGEIKLENGEILPSDYSIVTGEASKLIKNMRSAKETWESCDTLYFETGTREISQPLIGLIPEEEALINNIFYPSSISSKSGDKKQLLSVTVVKNHNLEHEEFIQRIQQELKDHCGIGPCKFLKRYTIAKALPKLSNLQYEMLPSETSLTGRIFLAGDTQLNASLNAAMISGERAALGLIEKISS